MAYRFKTKEELYSGDRSGLRSWVPDMNFLLGKAITDAEAKIILGSEGYGYKKQWYPELCPPDCSCEWWVYEEMIIKVNDTQSKIKVGDIVKCPDLGDYEFEVLNINMDGGNALCYSKKFSAEGRGHSGGSNFSKDDVKGHWNIDVEDLKLIKSLNNDTDVRTTDQHRINGGTSTTICSRDIQLAKSGRPTGCEAASFKFGS